MFNTKFCFPDQWTFANYSKLLSDLKKCYTFLSFSDNDSSAKRKIFLRHDIDVHPNFLDPLLEVETSLDIRSDIYLLNESPLYTIEDMAPKVTDLLSNGFTVNLHFEYDKNSPDSYEAQHLVQLERFVNVTGHQPKLYTDHKPRGQTHVNVSCNELINAHSANVNGPCDYISDSRGQWNHSNHPLKKSHLMLLTHPIWWNQEHVEPLNCLLRASQHHEPHIQQSLLHRLTFRR